VPLVIGMIFWANWLQHNGDRSAPS